MEDSVFTKIISGELPSHKVYEDDKTIAFMSIQPISPGDVLVVPKVQIDKFYDLPDEDYQALFSSAKKIAQHMEKVLGQRILMQIFGIDVPHAHIHLYPLDPTKLPENDVPFASDYELESIAKKLHIERFS